ncbi:MAG: adenosine kinase [Candidatus Moranbacteria bacterium]|nr:adenosine kinase [Candidatus Moranbacteria bacterium]
MKKEYDIIGVGNPLLDIIFEVEEALLISHKLKKGGMHLVTSAQSQKIFAGLKKYKKTFAPGGSAANTLSGVGVLGGKGLFLGSIGRDKHGDAYLQALSTSGVKTKLARHAKEKTGSAITLITPGGERTFVTCLGAASCLREEHIAEKDIQKSKILHIEGYLLEEKNTRRAVLRAMNFARKHATLVSIDLSDAGIIMRKKVLIRNLIRKYADIVFVNEDEAFAFTGEKERAALEVIGDLCDIAVVKLGARGSLIKSQGQVYMVDPYRVVVMNTNGAGDMYAAGFLHGLAGGHEIPLAGQVASCVAALVVSSPGARIHTRHHKKLKNVLKLYSQKKKKKLRPVVEFRPTKILKTSK